MEWGQECMIEEIVFSIILFCSIVISYVLFHLLQTKYIKVDVILKNAIQEALDQAKINKNTFEVKAYTTLLEDIKRKIR